MNAHTAEFGEAFADAGIGIGKQLFITRGAVTTFSIANDVAKYFAILPAMFTGGIPALAALNIKPKARPRLNTFLILMTTVFIPSLSSWRESKVYRTASREGDGSGRPRRGWFHRLLPRSRPPGRLAREVVGGPSSSSGLRLAWRSTSSTSSSDRSGSHDVRREAPRLWHLLRGPHRDGAPSRKVHLRRPRGRGGPRAPPRPAEPPPAGRSSLAPQDWRTYLRGFLLLNLVGLILAYAVLRLTNHLPLSQAKLPPQSPLLAFNTAVSFVTNTNWQAYAGETLTYFGQLALMLLQFVSPAVGVAIAAAFVRAFVRNFSECNSMRYRGPIDLSCGRRGKKDMRPVAAPSPWRRIASE